MKKLFFGTLFLQTILFANFTAIPTEACQAFNNMKHTSNTNNVRLELSTSYKLLKKNHKGQHLVYIKGEHPAQRWVDIGCFTAKKTLPTFDLPNPVKSPVKSYNNTKVTSSQNLLALSWHNAFCETHRYKKECKRSLFSLGKKKYSDEHFVLHGLWPQPRSNVYCKVDKALMYADKNKKWRDLPCLALDEDVENNLEKVMPGFASDLHKHEWIKHGTCYGTDANTYYKDAINLTKQVNNSEIGKFFQKNISKVITLQGLRFAVDKSFGRGAGKRVELRCKGKFITEIWLHLGSGSSDLKTLLQKGKTVRSRCKKGYIDRVGF